MTVIPSAPRAAETHSDPQPIVEITRGLADLQWTPNFASATDTLLSKADQVILRRSIWNLEFAFKPVRMIEVDVPQPSGKMQRKRIWYMVYRVKNVGYDLSPVPAEDATGNTTYDSQSVNVDARRFFPHFVLESHEYEKAYLDRVIPAAQEAIQRRERPGVKLHNSVEITQVPIPLSDERIDRSVWGVATWEDIDPRVDYFSVFVGGLTNAYQSRDPENAFQAGDPPATGREYQRKTLQLNFWRPGDVAFEHEKEIRYGVPIESDPALQQSILERYGLQKRLDYQWVYR